MPDRQIAFFFSLQARFQHLKIVVPRPSDMATIETLVLARSIGVSSTAIARV